MATVVIVHAAEDALPARALAEKLRHAKLTVTLEMPPGEQQREAIKGANAVVALWSPRSVEQQGVIEDAQFAKKNGGVVHARMQNAATPSSFGGDKSIDLTGWRGEDEFAPWRELAKAVTSKAGVPMIPPPAPRPPSGFFQPGGANPALNQGASGGQKRASPPQQRAAAPQQRQQPQQRSAPPPRSAPRAASEPQEKKGGGKTVIIAIVTFLIVAAAAGGGWFYWNNLQASQATASAWDDVDKTDAAALRAFIAGTPGDYRDEADTALTQLEEQTWDAAQEADSIDAFNAFLADFPDSDHALEARGRIQELQSQPVEQTTTTTDTTTAIDPDLLPPTTTAPQEPGGPTPLTPTQPTP